MASELEFDGTLANVCEYLEILGVFDEKVGALLRKIKVTGIECDSRRVTPGTIFYAKKGQHYNPFEHLEEIKAKGAVAILIDGPESDLTDAEFERMQQIAPNPHSTDGVTIEQAETEDFDQLSRQMSNRKSLIDSLRSPIQSDSETEDQLRRSGRKVKLNRIHIPRYALESYHATSETPEAQAITDANMFRLVLPSTCTLSALAGFIYGEPSHKLKVIGVTGTNGKSTITNLVAQMLNLSGHRCAIFGTLGYGFLDDLQKSANTTLDAISLQRELAHYASLGADYAVLEVSSIGYCENRVSGLRFYAGGFSNLSQDHLDYHKTMEDYFHAKLSFLKMIPAERLVVNRNREYGRRLVEIISNTFEVGVENSFFDKRTTHNFLNIKKVNYKHSSLELMLNNGEKGFTRTELKLMGYFNAENYAVALGIMLAMGFEYKHMASLAPKLKPITGRMESFVADYKPQMIVDYAHTPDGVEQALKAAQAHLKNRGRIFAIIGCGGDRDKGKRPIMAMKASIFSDYAIFTADNPRSEDVCEIIDDMLLGIAPSPAKMQLNQSLANLADANMVIDGDASSPEHLDNIEQTLARHFEADPKQNAQSWRHMTPEEYMEQPLPSVDSPYKNVLIIPDREKAIEYAYKHATAQDCIVIAGKGHEDYQILNDRTIHFSDREICCRLLGIDLPENATQIVIEVDKVEAHAPNSNFAEVEVAEAGSEKGSTKKKRSASKSGKTSKAKKAKSTGNDESADKVDSSSSEPSKDSGDKQE